MRAPRNRTVSSPASSLSDWQIILDLSRDPVGRNTYKLLAASWWPHPAHGRIDVMYMDDALVYRCACGETLGIPLFAAHDLGLVAAR